MKSIKFIVAAFVIVVLFRSFFITSYEIQGVSMQPAYHSGDRVFVNIIADMMAQPKEGDVIFFKLNERQTMVKRIAAAPGDYVAIHRKRLFINGKATRYQSSSLKSLTHVDGMKEQIVPEKCYIVLGDNLAESIDSRTYGCIDQSKIIGRVMLTYWPASKE